MSKNRDEKSGAADFFSGRVEEGSRLWAILDGASDPGILGGLLALEANHVSLYKGEPEEKYGDVAPFLVDISEKSPGGGELREWIFQKCWSRDRAVFFESDADMEALLGHFKRWTIVLDESGKGMYFRFYDPRALRTCLPAFDEKERARFFGPLVSCFFVESEQGEVLKFRRPPGAGAFPVEREPSLLVIRKEMMEAAKDAEREKFILRSMSFLKENAPIWSLNRHEMEMRAFIDEMRAFARRFDVRRGSHIQRLMFYRLEYGFDFPLPGRLRDCLTRTGMDEDLRMERFYLELRKRRESAGKDMSGGTGE
jgi:hypothetical protein